MVCSKGPEEISDEARTRNSLSLTPHFVQAASPVRDVEVWGRTELGKRQSPHVPSLDNLETTTLVLVCGREKMEHSGSQNTALL